MEVIIVNDTHTRRRSGSQLNYADIIDDCINVFSNIPELFRLRTNFGVRNDSSLNVSDYGLYMHEAVQRVNVGRLADSDAWCEDAHFSVIVLLFDITIFTYSMQHKHWRVFNESGSRGYVCLLSTHDHFDVVSMVLHQLYPLQLILSVSVEITLIRPTMSGNICSVITASHLSLGFPNSLQVLKF